MKIKTYRLGNGQAYRILPLDWAMERKGFTCGNNNGLDQIILSWREDIIFHYKIYVALLGNKVIGFYAIGAENRLIEPEWQYRADQPAQNCAAVYLYGLAVHHDLQNQKIVTMLMLHCLEVTLEIANLLGVEALFLDAIDDRLARFYENLGFERNYAGLALVQPESETEPEIQFPQQSIEMFIRISTLRNMTEQAARIIHTPA